jgi:hypothetical protein
MSRNEQLNQLNKVKLAYQGKIVTFLLLIIFSFLVLFVPLEKLGITPDADIWNYIYKLATSAVFTFLLRIPLFATDPLATGNKKHSVFFRSYYPSTIISSHYNIDNGKAQDLWFDFFNLWGDPSCRFHSQWKTVLKRTYDCRLIFYFSRLVKYEAILVFLFLIVIVVLNYFNIYAYNIEFKHFFFLGSLIIIYFSLVRTNMVKIINKEYAVSGCWYKYKEISLIEHSIVEREILKKYPTYQDAISNFDQIQKSIK